ncbi:hypothetical protein H5410_064612 [Solanum commersonii]|uniref:SWIM-type domain-containing protein n=1 Tax=Solanum commersonii TaxID=4109 RepID=A0A9J5VYW0_SOLCO|nr:hypothetical protein H5410_064612 [Solanum commersonii]
MVDNNFIESFNAWILEARHMPIIKMLEEIRVKVMRRLVSNEAKVEFNGDFGYEVTKGDNRHTINLKDKRCTCRSWDLSGIPMLSRPCCMIRVEPGTQIHWYYCKEAYLLTYKNKIQPIRKFKF